MFSKFTRNISLYSYFSFIPFLAMMPVIIYLFWTGIIPSIYLFATLIGWILTSGLGIATGYHRIFCHKTHPNLPTWKENVILFWGAMGGQGSSITWTAIHRGYHHRYSDTEKDLHSPVNGLWHSFFGWTLKVTENSNVINMKSAVDLLRKPNHVWFHKHQLKIQWGVPILLALFNWQLALALFVLPTGISILQDNFVNVFAHRKFFIGYRMFDTGPHDNSHNNLILGLIGWGQGWHHGHHYKPMAFNPGSAVSGNWWEIDTCCIFIPFIGYPRDEARYPLRNNENNS